MSVEFTREEPAPGLFVWQPRRGFRYAMDPFLLAGFALEGGRPARFLDAGTGSGIAALLLARQGLAGEGTDVRPEWIALARRSAAESGLEVAFHVEDLRERRAEPVPLALMNPPFWPLAEGPVSPDPLKAAARSELNGALAELIGALSRAGARVALVLPARREAEAVTALAAHDRPLTRRVRVDRSLVLLEGRAGGALLQDERVALREGAGWSAWARATYAAVGARL